jgi:hypothetical protein
VLYRVIYDARETLLPNWTFVAGLLFFVAIALAVWGVGAVDGWLWSPRRVGQGVPDDLPPPMLASHGLDRLGQAMFFRTWGPRIAAVFTGMAVLAGLVEFSAHTGLRRALERGDYTVVEGTVSDFVRGDRGGHRDEQFSVRSGGRLHTYRYRSSVSRPGFHQSHGPIRAGLRVRIADVDGNIARLEVAP